MLDYFGNVIDPEVDYARGKILSSSFEEKKKMANAIRVIQKRMMEKGEDSFYIFTGNIRGNQLRPEDLGIMSEEWVGPSLFMDKLRELGIAHACGNPKTDDVVVFNRTSAANVSTVLALGGPDKLVVSFAPQKKHHPSVSRGGKLSQSNLIATDDLDYFESLTASENGGVCLITSVTSELKSLTEEQISRAIQIAHSKGMVAVVDDAYGSRIGRYVLGNKPSLQLGADAIVFNNDKAALNGPRAGVMVGHKDIVNKIHGKASELGMEARAPIACAVYRSLEKFDPKELEEEIAVGSAVYEGLRDVLGEEYVNKSLLGPEVTAESVLKLVLERANVPYSECVMVPCETTSALGMELISFGVITTNACGMPGARISVRLKTNKSIVDRMGGVKEVINAFTSSLDRVAEYVTDYERARQVILGE